MRRTEEQKQIIGKNIKKWRILRGLSERKLAIALGIENNIHQISLWESGKSSPRDYNIKKICAILNIQESLLYIPEDLSKDEIEFYNIMGTLSDKALKEREKEFRDFLKQHNIVWENVNKDDYNVMLDEYNNVLMTMMKLSTPKG